IFPLQKCPQPIGHDDLAQVAFDLAAVLITITRQREQPINRRRFELRFRALVRHFQMAAVRRSSACFTHNSPDKSFGSNVSRSAASVSDSRSLANCFSYSG